MSSIFRNVMMSRRKRKKTRSTTPVNATISSGTSKPSEYGDYLTKKNQPRQQRVSSPSKKREDGDEEKRRESLPRESYYPTKKHHPQRQPQNILQRVSSPPLTREAGDGDERRRQSLPQESPPQESYYLTKKHLPRQPQNVLRRLSSSSQMREDGDSDEMRRQSVPQESYYPTKKHHTRHPQSKIQRVSSRTTREDGDGDERRRQSLPQESYYPTKKHHSRHPQKMSPQQQESNPSRIRLRSSESPFLSGSPATTSSSETTTADVVVSSKSFWKYRRRKSKHTADTEQQHDTDINNADSMTSNTVASGRCTPNNNQQQSSSNHERELSSSRELKHEHQPHRGRSRSFDQSPHSSRDKEIYTPDTVVSCEFTPNEKPTSNQRTRRASLSSIDELSEPEPVSLRKIRRASLSSIDEVSESEPVTLRFKQKDDNDQHHQHQATSNNVPTQATTKDRIAVVQMTKRSSGTSKTVIMDGNVVESKPVARNNSNKGSTTRNNVPGRATTKDRIEVVQMGKRSSGTSRTVIMDGNVVESKPVARNNSNKGSTSDAVTIASTASSKSKAKAMHRKSERNARAASALDDKGNELFEKGYFDRAMACYTKALKLKRRTFAHLLEETEDVEDTFIMLDDDGKPADPDALVSMATSINNIGYLRQRSGDATPEETMAAYKKSLRIKRRILGNDSLSVGKTLNNIGSVHYLKRDFERALAAYDEALEIMKANLGDKHPDVATVMSNVGDVYLAQDNKEISIKNYRMALAIRWEAFGERSPRVVRLLEKISNLEIGDMSSNFASQMANNNNNAWGDDVASEVMAGSEWQSVSEALRILDQQVKNDIEQVDQMERNAPVETLKDRIIVIRGMRDAWNGSGPELLDNDSASVKTAMSRLAADDGCRKEWENNTVLY